jgi:hypothetical protein
VRISRQTVNDGPGGVGTSRSGEDVRVLRPGDIRSIGDRHALVVAGNAPPIIARLRRCLEGKEGLALKGELDAARAELTSARGVTPDVAARTAAAVAYARAHRLHAAEVPEVSEPPAKEWRW